MTPELFIIAIFFISVIAAIASRLFYVDHLDRKKTAQVIKETETQELFKRQIRWLEQREMELKKDNQSLLDRLFIKENLPPTGTDIVAERIEQQKERVERKLKATNTPRGIGMLQQAQMAAIAQYDVKYAEAKAALVDLN